MILPKSIKFLAAFSKNSAYSKASYAEFSALTPETVDELFGEHIQLGLIRPIGAGRFVMSGKAQIELAAIFDFNEAFYNSCASCPDWNFEELDKKHLVLKKKFSEYQKKLAEAETQSDGSKENQQPVRPAVRQVFKYRGAEFTYDEVRSFLDFNAPGDDLMQKYLKYKSIYERVNNQLAEAIRINLTKQKHTSDVSRNEKRYIEALVNFPWVPLPHKQVDLQEFRAVMDNRLFGMTEVKEKLVQYVAVKNHAGRKGLDSFLLLAGPPGVGKTSVVKAFADAIALPFAQINLNGVSDALTLKGSAKNYSEARPGKIVQTFLTARTTNLVLLLDEIDKMGSSSHNGDPVAVISEFLNGREHGFTDEFLDFPIDISNTLIIATSNRINEIPQYLLDRFEVIKLSDYSEQEKIQILKKHIIPNKLNYMDVSTESIVFPDSICELIVRSYAGESGIRSIEAAIKTLISAVLVYLQETYGLEYEFTEPFIITEEFVRKNVSATKKTKLGFE